MGNQGLVVVLATAAMTVVAPRVATAQPDGIGVDVPITIVLGSTQSGTCSYSFTPRSNVTMPLLGSSAYERGTNRLFSVVNCGTVTNRVTITDTVPGLPTIVTTGMCQSTTGCTAAAAQWASYLPGLAGDVEFLTKVTARNVSICYVDHWAVVGGAGATYVTGGPIACPSP